MNIFEEANNCLEYFIKNKLNRYHELRNYDYGIGNHSKVSQISKYTSHRILYEYDILEKLKSVDKKKKFSDEILWRLYWKGYLENYHSIWIKYRNLNGISYDSNLLKIAQNGNTGIDFFDSWVEELRETNYLHNHSRMWFASIWIYTLKLPWELGSRFFMKHLLDGDAASNTLSWRWIAGLHTNKRPYLASKENINKYTNNRFNNIYIKLANGVIPINESEHLSNKLPIKKISNNNHLVMFDNDLNINNRSSLFNSYAKVYIFQNDLIEDNSRQSSNVCYFKQTLLQKVNNLIPNSEISNSHDIDLILKDLKSIDIVYPGVGNNLDLINNYSKLKRIKVNYIYRDKDLLNWKFARSGFYKFKKSFINTNNY